MSQGFLASSLAVGPEVPVPDGSFPLEGGGRTESERQGEVCAVPVGAEAVGTEASFPLESDAVVGVDLNARRSVPLENSGVVGE